VLELRINEAALHDLTTASAWALIRKPSVGVTILDEAPFLRAASRRVSRPSKIRTFVRTLCRSFRRFAPPQNTSAAKSRRMNALIWRR